MHDNRIDEDQECSGARSEETIVKADRQASQRTQREKITPLEQMRAVVSAQVFLEQGNHRHQRDQDQEQVMQKVTRYHEDGAGAQPRTQ